MPQGKQTLALPLGQGLAQEHGTYIAPAGRLASAINADIDKLGTVGIRPGFAKRVETNYYGGTFHPTFREWICGDQNLASDGYRVASWAAGLGKWIEFDDVPEANITKKTIADRGIQDKPWDAESIYCNGMHVYGWSNNSNRIYISAVDAVSGARYPIGSFATVGLHFRLVALGTRVYIIWHGSASDLCIKYLDTAAPAAGFSATTIITASLDIRKVVFEACTDGTLASHNIYVVCNVVDGVTKGRLFKLGNDMLTTHQVNTSSPALSLFGISAVAGKEVYVAWDQDIDDVCRCESVQSADLLAGVGSAAVDDFLGFAKDGGAPVLARLSVVEPPAGTHCWIVFEVMDSGIPTYQSVCIRQFGPGGAGLSGGTTYGMSLTSSAFMVGNYIYATMFFTSKNWSLPHYQPNSYLCELRTGTTGGSSLAQPPSEGAARVVVRIAQQRSGRVWLGKLPSTVSWVDASTVAFAVPKLSDTQVGDTGMLVDEGFDIYEIGFKAASCGLPVTIGPHLALSGGVPCLFDGRRVFECGFNTYPRAAFGTKVAGGSLTALGVYSWKFVYRWIDSTGTEHQSAPSEPITYTLGALETKVNIDVDCLNLTAMEDDEEQSHLVAIDMYRTVDSGSTYYLETVTGGSTPNSRNRPNVSIQSSMSDAALQANRILYTDGGVLPNEQCPASKHLAVHNNRLFSIVADYPNTIWYSKQIIDSEGPAFCKAFVVSNNQAQSYTALADAGSNIMVARRGAWDVVYGSGPGDAGTGPTYEEPVVLAPDVGCIDARSLVPIPGGYLFQAEGGVYAINFAGQTEWVGAPIRDSVTLSNPIVWGCLDASRRRALLIASNGSTSRTYVYYYTVQQWTEWKIPDATGTATAPFATVCLSGGLLHYCGLDGHIITERSTSSQDADLTWPTLTLRWAWLSPHGPQGYGSAWKATILGTRIDAHKADVTLYHDYVTTLVSTHSFTETEIAALVSGSREQIEIACKNTQGEAVQIQLLLTSGATPATGKLMRVEGLAIEYGTEPGLMRVPQSARK